jgi:hypothetical protein
MIVHALANFGVRCYASDDRLGLSGASTRKNKRMLSRQACSNPLAAIQFSQNRIYGHINAVLYFDEIY